LNAHLDQLKLRKKNIQLINDQVGGWSRRVGKKLSEQLDDHTLDNKNVNMIANFRNIAAMVTQQLKELNEQREQAKADNGGSDSEESMNVKELINDFATDEFLNKNVRVRPVSSYSMAGAGKEQELKSQAQTQEDEDEKKFNSEALYDMMQQRYE